MRCRGAARRQRGADAVREADARPFSDAPRSHGRSARRRLGRVRRSGCRVTRAPSPCAPRRYSEMASVAAQQLRERFICYRSLEQQGVHGRSGAARARTGRVQQQGVPPLFPLYPVGCRSRHFPLPAEEGSSVSAPAEAAPRATRMLLARLGEPPARGRGASCGLPAPEQGGSNSKKSRYKIQE